MKHKEWLLFILGVLVCGAVVFGAAERSSGDDGFYVIPVTNRNIKMVDGNTAIGIGALNSNTSGDLNTASGYQALYSNTSGFSNTATGDHALHSNTTGYENTATGDWVLSANSTGSWNTACGHAALSKNTAGGLNTAIGYHAHYNNTTGNNNIAIGVGALFSSIYGNNNIALGFEAGYYKLGSFSGSNNIYIGDNVAPMATDEANTIRIGNDEQVRTFIKGIYGNTVTNTAVYVNSAGRLGTLTSSRRFKEDIRDMGNATSGLMRLRPVTFHYKPEYAGGPRTLQYGLIAEEVAEVYPELVQYDPTSGDPQTVSYHLVNAMLLNEVQKQQRQILAQNQEISDLNQRLARLEALLDK